MMKFPVILATAVALCVTAVPGVARADVSASSAAAQVGTSATSDVSTAQAKPGKADESQPIIFIKALADDQHPEVKKSITVTAADAHLRDMTVYLDGKLYKSLKYKAHLNDNKADRDIEPADDELPNDDMQTLTVKINMKNLSKGMHNLKVYAHDVAGNEAFTYMPFATAPMPDFPEE